MTVRRIAARLGFAATCVSMLPFTASTGHVTLASMAEGIGRSSGDLALRVGPALVVPVSRDRAPAVRDALVSRTVGARR